MTDNIKSVYFGGLTAKRGDDGFMYVKGIATDDTLDLDKQICDPDWLKAAMPKWMEIGNIREMHQSKAVGKATEMEHKGSGFVVTAKIVDEQAAKMVEEGIYTGFSVGIKGARVVKDASAPGGRIISGAIVEVSLVDRPANPSAVIEIAKSIKGELVKGAAVSEIDKAESPAMNTEANMTEEPGVSTDVLDHDTPNPCQSCAGTGKKSNVMGNTQETDCEVCDGTGVQPDDRLENMEQHTQAVPQGHDNRDMKDAEPDTTVVAPSRLKTLAGEIEKMQHDLNDLNAVRQSLINLMKAELDEMASGEDNNIDDVAELLQSLCTFLCWWNDESSENETPPPFTSEDETDEGVDMSYDMGMMALGVSADLFKNANAETATPEVKDELRNEIVKALGLEEVMTAKAELSKATEEIELLKAALDEVKSMAAPGGPALRATREQTSKSAAVIANEVEAIRLRNLADRMTDPALRNQYLESARRLESNN